QCAVYQSLSLVSLMLSLSSQNSTILNESRQRYCCLRHLSSHVVPSPRIRSTLAVTESIVEWRYWSRHSRTRTLDRPQDTAIVKTLYQTDRFLRNSRSVCMCVC